MDDLDADSDGESEVDDAMYMEMAFDKTQIVKECFS